MMRKWPPSNVPSLGWFLLLMVGLVSCGCHRRDTFSQPGASSIQIQLNWIPDAQHGGFYAARENFEDAGFAAEVLPGGPGTPAISKLAAGRCDFAIGNADQVLLARQQGADVVAVFAAMQNSPRCIMVHKSSNIGSLEQLRDLTLALGDGKAFAEYLKRRAPLENVRIVSYSGTVAKFLLDKDYAQQGYVFSEPILAASQGGDPQALMLSDLGFNPYSSLLVTRRQTLEQNPELVRHVVRAVRAGWESYLATPEKTNARIVADNPDMDVALLNQSAAAIQPLCRPPGLEGPLGSMSLERWETLRDQLIELELLPADAPPASLAFTNELTD